MLNMNTFNSQTHNSILYPLCKSLSFPYKHSDVINPIFCSTHYPTIISLIILSPEMNCLNKSMKYCSNIQSSKFWHKVK